MKTRYRIECTDTFGGDANYCWVRRFSVRASSFTGAARVAARQLGYSGRIRSAGSWGSGGRWDVSGAAVCFFVEWFDETASGEAETFPLVN